MNIREEMILKGTMGHNEFMVNEMAAAHLVKVVKLIKSGEIEKAAQEYLDAGGVPGGVTRTINHYIKSNPNQDNSNFEKFKEHFSGIRKKEGADKPTRKYTKKTAEEGRQGQRAAKKRLETKIVQQYNINREFIEKIKAKSDEDLKKKAKEIIEDLTVGKTFEEDKKKIQILKDFKETGEGKNKAIEVIVGLLKKGLISIRDFGLWAEKPESFITPESKKRAEARIKKIKEKEDK